MVRIKVTVRVGVGIKDRVMDKISARVEVGVEGRVGLEEEVGYWFR